MHRTFGDGFVEEPGPGQYHRFIDQNLPTYDGTVDTAEYNNAVQEEICNVITGAGLTLNGGGLNGDPAADRAAGWSQLYEAIFQAGHITDAAIDGITFSKLSGQIDLTDSGKNWVQDTDGLIYTQSTAHSSITPQKLETGETGIGLFQLKADEGLYFESGSIHLRADGRGIRYPDGPGNETAFESMKFRRSSWVIPGTVTWVPIGSSTVLYTTSGLNYDTDIPVSVPLAGIRAAWIATDNGITVEVLPASVSMREVGGSGFYRVLWISVLASDASAPGTTVTLTIEYDASTLT
jgi:hypothetical protein